MTEQELREKIARKLYESAATERDTSITEYNLDLKKSWPWGKLKESSKEYWKQIADQIIALIKEAGYVRLAEDQSLPKGAHFSVPIGDIADAARQRMLQRRLPKDRTRRR